MTNSTTSNRPIPPLPWTPTSAESEAALRAAASELRWMARRPRHEDHHAAAAVLQYGVAMDVTIDHTRRGPLGNAAKNAAHAQDLRAGSYYIEGFATPDIRSVVWHAWVAQDASAASEVTWPTTTGSWVPYIGLPIRRRQRVRDGVWGVLPQVHAGTCWAELLDPVLDLWRAQSGMAPTGLW